MRSGLARSACPITLVRPSTYAENRDAASPDFGRPISAPCMLKTESCQIHDSHRQTPRPSDSVRLAGLRRTDVHLPDDFVTPFSHDLAQRPHPVHSPLRLHWLPGNARTIVGNDTIADHPEAGHFEFGRKLTGSHVGLCLRTEPALKLDDFSFQLT